MSRPTLPGQPGDPWRSEQETQVPLPSTNGSRLSGITRTLLQWLGIAITFAAVDWGNQRQVYRILQGHKIPRAGILSEVISFRVRNHRRPWRIRFAFLAFLVIWPGLGLLLSWLVSDMLGAVYLMVIGLYLFWVVTSILGFILNRPDKSEGAPK